MILLDVKLPDGDGFQMATEIQADPRLKAIPLIFITAQGSLSDRVFGFNLGADDYIVKPFEILELKARVEARLKKMEEQSRGVEILRRGPLEVHLTAQKVFVVAADRRADLDLTPIEFKILVHLVQKPLQIWSREELVKSIWGDGVHMSDRNVDTHVSKLRKKLGTLGRSLRAVHGSGYQMSVENPET
jgi:DNA-binding response OmpR family regulator